MVSKNTEILTQQRNAEPGRQARHARSARPLREPARARSGAAGPAGKWLLGKEPVSQLKEDPAQKCCHRPGAPGSLETAGSGWVPEEAFGGRSGRLVPGPLLRPRRE